MLSSSNMATKSGTIRVGSQSYGPLGGQTISSLQVFVSHCDAASFEDTLSIFVFWWQLSRLRK